MMDPPPPDPYAALDVPRDASSATIKSAYRKLALKYHPDKAKDKGEEFHRIRQAYELIGEDDARRKYDDQVRLTDLRKDLFARRGSAAGYGPNSPVRTTDGRNRASSSAGFEARGAPRYEERRPPKQYQANGPTARAPYVEEEQFDSYFTHRTAARKQDGYDGSTRRQPSTRSPPPKPVPRAEATREAMKKDKATSAKNRNERKKQRDQENARERKGKFSSMASVDSGDSDEGYQEELRRRGSEYEPDRIRKENARGVYEDPRSQKFQRQTTNVADYINRSKTEGVPVERGSPPPPPPPTQQYPPENIPQEIPLRSRPGAANEPQYEIREPSRDPRSTPAVRKAAAKFKEKSQGSARNSKSESRSKLSGAASPEPHKTERKPPTLQTGSSAPASLKVPKSRTADDYVSRGADVPRAERAATTTPVVPPSKRNSTRKDNTMPAVSSGLRHAETNDSGYSTSSPSETPNPPMPTSKIFQYGIDSVQVEIGEDNEPWFRDSEPFRRDPSPLRESEQRDRTRERDRDHDRTRGSGARDRPRPRDHNRDREREREREGALRSSSYQNASSARNSADLERPSPSSSRRPSMPQRTSSSRAAQSSSRTPTLNRGSTSPNPTPKWSGSIPTQNPNYFFGEIPRTTSPVEFTVPNYEGNYSGQTAARGDDRGYSRRFPAEEVSYTPYAYASGGGSGYYSSSGTRAEMANAASGQPRRGSEDLAAKARAEAFAYMASSGARERSAAGPPVGGLKKGSTFVY